MLSVAAAALSPWARLAFRKGQLRPLAVHVVQPDTLWPGAEVRPIQCRERHPAAQLPAHDLSVLLIPAAVTDGSPLLLVKHLDSASAAVRAVCQLEVSWLRDDRVCKHPRELLMPSDSHQFPSMLILLQLSSQALFKLPEGTEEGRTGGVKPKTPPRNTLHQSISLQRLVHAGPAPSSAPAPLPARIACQAGCFRCASPQFDPVVGAEGFPEGREIGRIPVGMAPAALNKHHGMGIATL